MRSTIINENLYHFVESADNRVKLFFCDTSSFREFQEIELFESSFKIRSEFLKLFPTPNTDATLISYIRCGMVQSQYGPHFYLQ